MRHLLMRSSLALLLASGSARADDVWIVGPDGFDEVQSAVDAAQNGDAILIRPGVYAGFVIDGKALRIIADEPCIITSIVRVRNLAADRVVTLSNLFIRGGPHALRLFQNAGHVRVQSCTLVGDGATENGATVSACDDAFFTDCIITGGASSFSGGSAGGTGMRAISSSVAFYDCTVTGGRGGSVGDDTRAPGGAGGAGVRVDGGFVFLSGSTVTGGDGGFGGYCGDVVGGGPGDGGDGGHGVHILSDSTLVILDSMLEGGEGREADNPPGCAGIPASDGEDGDPLADDSANSAIDALTGDSRVMSVEHHDVVGESTVELTFHGLPGDQVFLPAANVTDFTYDVALKGVWQLDTPVTIPGSPVVTLPASGEASFVLAVPPPTPGQSVRTDYYQSYFVDSGGTPVLGTPESLVVLACIGEPATYCAHAANSVGAGAAIGWSGSVSLAANDLSLNVAGAVPNQFGVFFYGPDNGATLFGDGFLCVSGGAFRLEPPVLADGSGVANLLTDSSVPPMNSGAGQLKAGATWYFQFWYRDPFGPGGSGFNLSDALAIPFCP